MPTRLARRLALALLAVVTLPACDEPGPTDPASLPEPALATGRPSADARLGAPTYVTASGNARVGQWQQLVAQCPSGRRATGGGYLFSSEFYLTSMMVSRNQPMGDAAGVPTGWIVKIKVTGIDNAGWHVFAICMPV